MRQRKPNLILEVSDLTVRRGNTTILDGVSWSVGLGEHWAILGANGSGKTSLLSALTGYLMPSAGAIHVLGKRYGRADWRDLRRHIGLVSSSVRQMISDSEPALETVISGKYAMIDFWGRMTAAEKRRGMAILHAIECAHLAQRPWQFLSQGERQRVLIGRALMAHPQLLILDEPCAGLDPAAREHFLAFMDRLAREVRAPTLVLVTHHVEEIMPVFSHILALQGGRVLASGAKRELLSGKLLSEVFQTPMRLSRQAGRYRLTVRSKVSTVL